MFKRCNSLHPVCGYDFKIAMKLNFVELEVNVIKSYIHTMRPETLDVEHGFSLTRSSCPDSKIIQIVKTKLYEKPCQNQHKCHRHYRQTSKRDTSSVLNRLTLQM